MPSYTVKSHRNGKHTVAYECHTCSAWLESPLDEAGTAFPCPTCGQELTTPGVQELGRVRQAQRAKAEAIRRVAELQVEQTPPDPPVYVPEFLSTEPIEPRPAPVGMASIAAARSISGMKLFFIVSAAVACGITLAIAIYTLMFIAPSIRSNLHSSLSPSTLKDEDDDFCRAIERDDIAQIKVKMLGPINWAKVATPALIAAIQSLHFDSDLDLDDEKQARQFYTMLADRCIRNGANVNAAITKCSHVTGLEYLVSHGGNVNSRDPEGYTPLLRCADTGSQYADLYSGSIDYLIARGADVNAVNRDGDSAMHLAAKSNSPKIVKSLLAAGANVNSKNNSGQTPLAIAEAAMQTDAAAVLAAHGGH